MQNIIYVVEIDRSLSEYAQRLVALIKEQGIEAELCTLLQYKKMSSYSDTVFKGAIFIFIGTNFFGKTAISSVSNWYFQQFGCHIGWNKNSCVIYALSFELPYSEYQAFREHCKELHLEYPDVVIPPEKPLEEAGEFMKGVIGKKENISIQRAQYSIVIHEFMDNYFHNFWKNKSEMEIKDENVPNNIKDYLYKVKESALFNLTTKQAVSCHAIIHACATGCAAVAFLPVPIADTIPITAAQVSMVVALGKLFDNKLTKSDARVLLQTCLTPFVGRTLSKNILTFIPGTGWVINGGIAAVITESLGWSIASEFAVKSKNNLAQKVELVDDKE